MGDTAIVFSAQSLMGKHFHAPGDGHEVIHAKTHGGSIPQVILEAKNYKPTGKVGADLYGRVFSTDEIHSAYAFSVRTALKDIMKRNSEPAGEDAYTEVELTTLRNGLLNDLYQTAKPVYEAALKPGAIKKDLIKDNYGWGGDRTVLVETENGNSYWINFQSKQVNKWKLEQDPSASKDIDWSRDPKTVRALIERDYAASKQAARESDLLVGFLIGPNPQYESFLGAVDKVRQLRDFSTLTEKKVKKEEQIEAASRLLERGKNRLSESADTTQLAAALVRMQKRAAKENVPIPEGHLAFQRNDGSWITIDGNQKGNLPIQQILDEMLPPPQK
ncbi:hypothetical protein EBT16_10810 [bacterium]|nr:hypothetical protein [bacterium]